MGARVVLGAVGAVIGGYFGGPQGAQLGWAIGSTVGGIIDPDVIKGPQIGDSGAPTTSDGVPIPKVYGKGPVVGHLLWTGPKIKRISREQQDKGGPIVETEYETISFALCFGEGQIAGFRRIWMDEKLIYDIGAGQSTSAQAVSASGERFTALALYAGTPDQMPSAIIEAVEGVGNTPAYRNRCYLVFQDFNFTSAGNRLPVVRAEVVELGDNSTVEVTELVQPDYARFANRDFPLIDAEEDYNYTGYRVGSDAAPYTYSGDTIDEVIDYFQSLGDYSSIRQSEYLGYSTTSDDNNPMTPGQPAAGKKLGIFGPQDDVTDRASIILVYNTAQPSAWYDVVMWASSAGPSDDSIACPLASLEELRGDNYGFLYQAYPYSDVVEQRLAIRACEDPEGTLVWAIHPIFIKVTRKKIYRIPEFDKPCASTPIVAIPDAPEFGVDCDANIHTGGEGVTVSGTFRGLQSETVFGTGPNAIYENYDIGPVLALGDPNYNSEAYWEAQYAAAVAANRIEAGLVYPDDYPQAISYAVEKSITRTTLEPDATFFNDIVIDVCGRVGIGEDLLDLTLTEGIEVDGLTLAKAMGGDSALLVLCQVFQIDAGEWDGKLRFVPKGLASVRTLETRDLVRVGGPPVKQVIEQGIERAKSLRLAYQDPATNYIPTTQVSGQLNPDLTATSEGVISTPVVMTATRALQIVDRLRKEARANVEGEISFAVGPADSDLTVTDNVMVPRAGGLLRVRITRTDDEFGVRKITGRIDRPSSYASSRVGVARPPITQEMPGLIGPTIAEVMNLPALTDADDRPGLYVAIAGLLPGWTGAYVEAAVNGGPYQQIYASRSRATIGHTLTVLPNASELIVDEVNTLRVKVHGATLTSITPEVFYANGNAFALVYPDKSAEILQFKTAVQVDVDEYDLSYLARGRKATHTGEHPIGTAFVMLRDATFCPVPLSWINQPIVWRVTSLLTASDTGWTDFTTLNPMWSQSEWSPTFLQGERNEYDLISLSWNARDRLGTSAHPFPSQLFTGFRIQFIAGDQIEQVETDPETRTLEYDPVPVFGSAELTIRVFQRNSITGLSPDYQEIIL